MAEQRNFKELDRFKFNDEHLKTTSSSEQIEVEKNVQRIFNNFQLLLDVDNNIPRLLRREHIKFLLKHLSNLPGCYECLDASRTWICYWILHSLSLLQHQLPKSKQDEVIRFLKRCQNPNGGFGGGPGQYSHIATTYAAVNSLCIIGTPDAYKAINRKTLEKFLWDVRSPEGAFAMHRGGEVDIRGVYCALSAATLTNIATNKLFEGTAEWVVSCQTYEGGFSGSPGMEAHGGYAFCGLAALFLLKKAHLCDTQALLRWAVNRQMKFEGGFQGRTNKLVDGCYSFWQGGTFPLIHELLSRENQGPEHPLFNETALQEYILICCQYPEGGLIDKPGKPRDIYHTCYTLSGLSVAQSRGNILGGMKNKLGPTHSVFNISPYEAIKAISYFSRDPSSDNEINQT